MLKEGEHGPEKWVPVFGPGHVQRNRHGGSAGPQQQELRMIGALARKLFGTPNDRRVKGYQSRVNAINALEEEIAKLSDEALKARTEEFRKELAEGKTLDDI